MKRVKLSPVAVIALSMVSIAGADTIWSEGFQAHSHCEVVDLE